MARPIWKARSPLRIDFAGMTDYYRFSELFGGNILNATINLYIEAILEERRDQKIILIAPDLGQRVELEDKDHFDPKASLGLAQWIVGYFAHFIHSGLQITSYSRLPGGSGLGSSSTISTCLIGLLNGYLGYGLSNYQIGHLAIEAEQQAIQSRYGWQDQYSPVTDGGIKFMRWWPDESKRGLEVNHLQLDSSLIAELESNLVVVDSGIRRDAKGILNKVAQGVNDQESEVIDALKKMNQLADQLRFVFLQGQLDEIPEILNEIWFNHQRLHPDVTNDDLNRLMSLAKENFALGGRVCGAGGGGTMMFYAQHGHAFQLKKVLEKAGCRVIDYNILNHGMQVWPVQ